MERFSTVIWRRTKFVLATVLMSVFLVACEGDQGPPGAAGTTATNTTTISYATSLAIKIDSVSINSAPVVNFSVSNQDGTALSGLTTSDLRFTIAKLVPGSFGDASAWQSYINQESDGAMRASQERTPSRGTVYPLGELVDNDDGSYSYTFATNLNETAANCPAPCTDADGNPLDVSYNPALTHRVVIQLSHSTADLPPLNAVYTFRPSDGATDGLFSREIVKTESCNECHNQLRIHGSRVEVQFCVTCHNPGTWDGDNGNTADFKVMIHKIHMGEELPSVDAGGSYEIGGHDYSDVAFPQDIRNCTKCHDASDADTPQGGNWNSQISMEACGSCHDKLKFDVAGPPIPGATDPDGHPGGVMVDNSLCVTCHQATEIGKSPAEAHLLIEPEARKKFKVNILKICGTDVGAGPGPLCIPGTAPTVTFSVTNPTNSDAEYNLNTTPEITGSNLSFLVGWDTKDYNNTDGTGERPGRGDSIDFDEAGFVDIGNTRTVTAGFIIPDGTLAPPSGTSYTASGSGVIAAQGRFAGDFDGDGEYNEDASCPDASLPPPNGNCLNGERERIYVKNTVAYFMITDDPGYSLVERREVVDNNKCNQCHEQVSFHGGSRSGEALVCVICHNPNNTDVNDRPRDGAGGLDDTLTLDSKREESVDFKRMIHGIHAGAQTFYPVAPATVGEEAHGFREKGLVIGGTSSHDYSGTRFPGVLQDCETCHLSGTYELDGDWASPTQNGILASTTEAAPTSSDAATVEAEIIDPAIDLNISPTAAVCSSCHDGDVAKAHMVNLGGAAFDITQGDINTIPIVETCSVCHGPGHIADVEAVHAER